MDSITKQLMKLNLKKNDTVLIHSSLKQINRDAILLISELLDYFSDGMVLMPTHTWKTMTPDNNHYDPEVEPSCVGLLTEIFRNFPGVIRSLHPTHSMAGFGNKAAKYLSQAEDDQTPCSPTGAWGRLSEIDATILLVGCGFERNTFIHAIEEKNNVPNRFTEKPIEFLIKTNKKWIKRDFYKHYNAQFVHLSENYKLIEEAVINDGIVKVGKFGDADCLIFKAKELEEYVMNLLQQNLNFFTEI